MSSRICASIAVALLAGCHALLPLAPQPAASDDAALFPDGAPTVRDIQPAEPRDIQPAEPQPDQQRSDGDAGQDLTIPVDIQPPPPDGDPTAPTCTTETCVPDGNSGCLLTCTAAGTVLKVVCTTSVATVGCQCYVDGTIKDLVGPYSKPGPGDECIICAKAKGACQF